ncbi:MAG: arylesterase [Hyphomicrobiaceae bacterium]
MLTRLLGQMVLWLAAVNMAALVSSSPPAAAPAAGAVRIVALGDSLTAGYGLAPGEALPTVIERLLKAGGQNVEIANAGVSGDTTSGGLARLDWAVPDGTDAVILALGANDMLTGQPVARARANLEAIVKRLQARGIVVLLAGMRASRSLGDEYANAFDRIYPELAEAHGLLLYPFLLAGVALDPALNQPDGIHPTAEGVRRIAEKMLPSVEQLIAKVRARRQASR